MFLELQVSVHELKGLLQSRIRALPDLALTDPVGSGFVDRIRVGSPAFETATGAPFVLQAGDGEVTGRRLRARVPLVGTWVSEGALLEAGHRPAPWGLDHAAEAVVELDVFVDAAGRPVMKAVLLEILPPLDVDLPGMTQRLAGVCVDVEVPVRFPHEALLEVLLAGGRVRAAALSADPRRGVVAVRLEPAVGAPEPVARWAPFVAGRLDDHLGGAAFALYASADLLERTVRGAVGVALLGDGVDRARQGALPEVVWAPACDRRDPTVRPRLVVRHAEQASPEAVLTVALDPVDEALLVEASVTGETHPSLARGALGGEVLTALTSLLAGLAAPLVGPVAVPSAAPCHGPTGSRVCGVDRRLSGSAADLVLTAALGSPDGLVLRGRLERNRPKPDPELYLEAPEPFRWGPETCTSAALVASTVLRAHNPGSTPLHVRGVRALSPGFTAAFDRPVEVCSGEVCTIRVTGDPCRPVLLPTVCELLVQTTGGTRIVSVRVEPVSHVELLLAPLQRMAMCVVQAQHRPDLLVRPIDLVTGRARRAEPDPARIRIPSA